MYLVSIHAPAGGGDLAGLYRPEQRRWFQSTPPRGGRPYASLARRVLVRFNPRPRGGGDLLRVGDDCRPPRFNPRPRGGGDSPFSVALKFSLRFQSTPPRGGRQQRRRASWSPLGFNPRPRGGGATICSRKPPLARPKVSIHAPAGGATIGALLPGHVQLVSIHAPAGGATMLARASG